ncbi:hypothetical protein CV023_01585 [Brevibacterium sp. CCUG 69071]|nr:hypothetical protein [Brevibacterium sp. CCUG 69071]
MSITLNRIDPQGSDREALIEFFTSNDFPFHVRSEPWTRIQIEDHIDAGDFCSDDTAAYSLDDEVMGRVGYLRFEDLQDDTAMFERAGWTKEAHYRRAWPTADGHARDTVAYAILCEEWEHGTAVGFLRIQPAARFAARSRA